MRSAVEQICAYNMSRNAAASKTAVSPQKRHRQQDIMSEGRSIANSSANDTGYLPYDETDIFSRGQAFLQHKALKISQMHQHQQEITEKELLFRPEITKKALELLHDGVNRTSGDAYYSYSEQWREKVQSHLKQKKHQLEEEEQRRLAAQRTGLSKKSQYIIQKNRKQNKYRNPIEGWSERFEQFQKQRMEQSKMGDDFRPKINKKSEGLKRKGSVYSRLHQEARQKEKKLLSRREHRRAQELYDTATGQPLFTPQINTDKAPTGRTSRESKDKEVVYKELHSRAALLQKKRDEMAKSTPPNTTFKPKLDPHSLEIANQLYRKPLYSPRSAREAPEDKDVFHASQNGNGTPRRASKERLSLSGSRGALSPQLLQQHNDSTTNTLDQMEAAAQIEQFLERRKLHEQMKQERLRRLQERKATEEMKECTFKPSLNKNSRRMMDEHVRNLRDQRRERLRELRESFGVGTSQSALGFSQHYEDYSDSELSLTPSRRHSFDLELSKRGGEQRRAASAHYSQHADLQRDHLEWSDEDNEDTHTAESLSPLAVSPSRRRHAVAERPSVDTYVDRMVKDAWKNVVGGALPSPQLAHAHNSFDDEPVFHRRSASHAKYELDNEDHVLDTIQSDLESAFSDWTSLVQQVK